MRVFLTGATGEIGVPLVERLAARGDTPVVLSRSVSKAQRKLHKAQGVEIVEGNPMETGAWQASVRGCDAVINLVGEPIAHKPWTKAQKELIHYSRVGATHQIVETLRGIPEHEGRPKTLVSAGAIAYYGTVKEGVVDERSPAGSPDVFLTKVSLDWEKETFAASEFGVRTVAVRVSLVLSNGGAFLAALWPWRFGLGAQIGDGKQGMSWIHIDDMVRMFMFAIDNPNVSGPINGSAPQPTTNGEFSRMLAQVLHRPLLLRVPAFAVRLAMGELAMIVVEGQKVVPHKPLELGFKFDYPELRPALEALVSGKG